MKGSSAMLFFSKVNYSPFYVDVNVAKLFSQIIRINIFWGELTDVIARTKALVSREGRPPIKSIKGGLTLRGVVKCSKRETNETGPAEPGAEDTARRDWWSNH